MTKKLRPFVNTFGTWIIIDYPVQNLEIWGKIIPVTLDE